MGKKSSIMSPGYKKLAGTDYDTQVGNLPGGSGGAMQDILRGPSGTTPSTDTNLKRWVKKKTKKEQREEAKRRNEELPELPL